jgi:mandelamide amidase
MDRRTFLGGMLVAPTLANAQTGNSMLELTASEAIKAMRDGDIRAEDYANALLAQAERTKNLNAFITLRPDEVRAMARAADQQRAKGGKLGSLHGLPIPVKDSVNTKGMPTTNGTRALRDFHPRDDAAVLKALYAQGAFPMGKTNLHEMSAGWSSNNHAFGAVLNPFDTTRTPGGSSGGSAAAVAARVAPIAIAEDTYGSIRVPATFCGLTGLRATHGRYPADGLMPLAQRKFDQVGAVARSVRDLALFDSVVTGDREALSVPRLRNVRIAVPPELDAPTLDAECTPVIARAIERLQDAGATLVREPMPALANEASAVVVGILGHEIGRAVTEFLQTQGTGVSLQKLIAEASPNVRAILAADRDPGPREDYEKLLTRREQITAAINDYYRANRVDVIAFATSAVPAFPQSDSGTVKVNDKDVPLFTAIGERVARGSCASLSCLVLPAGLTASGLPVGIEFDAQSGKDRRLLNLGAAFEQALGFSSPRPRGIPSLR